MDELEVGDEVKYTVTGTIVSTRPNMVLIKTDGGKFWCHTMLIEPVVQLTRED